MSISDSLMATLPQEGCVLWTGSVDKWGYGKSHRQLAHRFIYERMRGPIPAGLQLDHLCHTFDLSCLGGVTCIHRRCVNPDHLEPVTREVNAARGVTARATSCKNGHAWTPENTYFRGRRFCRACNRETARRIKAKRAAA